MATLTVSPDDEKRVKAMGFLSNKGTDDFSARIITVNGKVTAEQLETITKAAKKYGNGTAVMTTRLTIEVPGVPYEKIDEFQEFIGETGLVTGGTGSKVRPVVACKGTTCQYGLLDSYEISEMIHNRFYVGYHEVRLPHKFKIAVGGCPNNCVKPDLNDLGIIGQLIPEYDPDDCSGCKKCGVEEVCPMNAVKRVDGILEIDRDICNNCGRCIGKCHFDALDNGRYGYKIYIGGRWGKKADTGRPLSKVFESLDEAMDTIEKAILLYREQGITGERFAATIERIGFENVEAQLLSNDILQRKQEILDAQLHLTGGATC